MADNIRSVDLNCDLGESFGHWNLGVDERVIPLISSANLACGMHAGDPLTIRKTIALAREAGVSVGAHPGYPDLQGFGRRAMALSTEEIYAYVQYQVAALAGMCRAQGIHLAHVKPHGALYNLAARDREVAQAIALAVRDLDPVLILVGLSGSKLIEAGLAAGLDVSQEFFADRAYQPDGTLVPRTQPGAVIEDDEVAVERVIHAIQHEEVTAIDGSVIPVTCDTICIHGDNPHALAFAQRIRTALTQAGIPISKMH